MWPTYTAPTRTRKRYAYLGAVHTGCGTVCGFGLWAVARTHWVRLDLAPQVYLVMELCSGGELRQRVQRGRYGEREAAYLLHEVLLTIAQCHARGIIVRDVKPDNFLFLDSSEDSPLKMIDFGLAQ